MPIRKLTGIPKMNVYVINRKNYLLLLVTYYLAQRGLICLKKSFPLSSTKINAGKSSTSIFQIAYIPNSGYSTHSMLLILF